MMQQAVDFRDESEALFRLVDPLPEETLESKTQFKGWTINDVVGHLHIWNWAADLSERGLAQYAGIMANYLYDARKIESNHEAYQTRGRVMSSKAVKGLLKG